MKENISSTSALILLWTRKAHYKSQIAQNYLASLNLEAGFSLYQKCSQIWAPYEEIIHNRKHGITHLLNQIFTKQRTKLNALRPQIIIAGAGLTPLGVEIISNYECDVFELDIDHMELKKQLLANCGVHFITADLTQPEKLNGLLRSYGWDPNRPTYIIFEGISYYLSQSSLKETINQINPKYILFEFLKEEENIRPEHARIAREIFNLIMKSCNLSMITRYSISNLKDIFTRSVLYHYEMQDLEKMRTGNNQYFPDASSGWISLCLLGSAHKLS